MTALSPAASRAMPKVLLHDHLDGGVRPRTIVELAAETGYGGLPTTDPDELQAWMTRGADRKDLVLYLETFAHTIGVMQTPEALARVARECAEDLADDGVVYAEIRYAPEQHLTRGLTLDEVVAAVTAGFEEGSGDRIVVRTLIDAMRTGTTSEEVARLAVRSGAQGVVGFDLAGAEAGYPPRDFAAALAICRDAGLPLTIHAGEAFGPASIDDALDQGALRIGHGVHIADDIAADGTLGPVARRVLDGADPARALPHLERALGRRGLGRGPPDRPVAPGGVRRDGEHRQPLDVLDHALGRMVRARRGLRLVARGRRGRSPAVPSTRRSCHRRSAHRCTTASETGSRRSAEPGLRAGAPGSTMPPPVPREGSSCVEPSPSCPASSSWSG